MKKLMVVMLLMCSQIAGASIINSPISNVGQGMTIQTSVDTINRIVTYSWNGVDAALHGLTEAAILVNTLIPSIQLETDHQALLDAEAILGPFSLFRTSGGGPVEFPFFFKGFPEIALKNINPLIFEAISGNITKCGGTGCSFGFVYNSKFQFDSFQLATFGIDSNPVMVNTPLLTAVPLPSSLILMLSSLILLGFMFGRKGELTI